MSEANLFTNSDIARLSAHVARLSALSAHIPDWRIAAGILAECGDCGRIARIHPDSDSQRGEPICERCAASGGFAP